MSKLSKALIAAAGNSGGAGLTVEDVFSTYLYTGNGSTQTITNDIDLAGEGGLVWIKQRSASRSHHLADTERGVDSWLNSDLTVEAQAFTTLLSSFNANGFTLETGSSRTNGSGNTYASWTFRKAEKFFDVVTYTGNGSSQNIAHNLGSTPSFVVVKRTSSAEDWTCYHQSVGATKYITLNSSDAASVSGAWNNTAPTDSVFTVGNHGRTNSLGETYVAYLFASDAGGFGDDGSESIIKCGSFTGNTTVDLGFEPAWIMIKPTNVAGNWDMHDVMRGWPSSGDAKRLKANLAEAETSTSQIYPNATGFSTLIGSDSYIYIAIRRPMKTPESGTEVFAAASRDTTGGVEYYSGWPVDFIINPFGINTTHSNFTRDRLRGGNYLKTESTDAELTGTYFFDSNVGFRTGSFTPASEYFAWMFKRATGFFDVVAYTGDGTGATTGRDINHNLGVVPDLMIIKKRNNTRDWRVGGPSVNFSSGDYEYNGSLNSDITFDGGNAGTAIIGGTFYYYRIPTIGHTATTFRVGNNSDVNASGDSYIAYLFATLAGVSKVGSYTGTGADLNVDCGFSAGARFILIKRTDSTGDWYVWDSVRGIVAGNDPYLLLNSTAAEVTSTDYIDPLASGFTVTSSAPAALNASGGTYIFMAIS